MVCIFKGNDAHGLSYDVRHSNNYNMYNLTAPAAHCHQSLLANSDQSLIMEDCKTCYSVNLCAPKVLTSVDISPSSTLLCPARPSHFSNYLPPYFSNTTFPPSLSNTTFPLHFSPSLFQLHPSPPSLYI